MQLESYRQVMILLREYPRIKITAHRHPEYVGQIRRVTLPSRYGFYSVVENQPEHEISRRHHGRGSKLWMAGAYHMRFQGDICEVHDSRDCYDAGKLIMAFQILNS